HYYTRLHPSRFPYTTLFRSHFGGLDISFGIDPVLHLSLDVGVIALALVVFNVLLPHHAKQLLDFRLRYGTVSVRSNVQLWSGSRSEEHTSELQSRENLVCRL